MIEQIKVELDQSMNKTISALKAQLQKVRTGRASPNLLDGIKVEYYGSPTPIGQTGQISTPEARLLQIQPYDKTLIEKIEKAILGANIGLTPSNDGNLIRIPIPALTEEKRKDLVKNIKKMGEEAKIALRNIRRDKNDHVKKAEKKKEVSEDDSKHFQSEIQTITDKFIKEVDELMNQKEKELMTV